MIKSLQFYFKVLPQFLCLESADPENFRDDQCSQSLMIFALSCLSGWPDGTTKIVREGALAVLLRCLQSVISGNTKQINTAATILPAYPI